MATIKVHFAQDKGSAKAGEVHEYPEAEGQRLINLRIGVEYDERSCRAGEVPELPPLESGTTSGDAGDDGADPDES